MRRYSVTVRTLHETIKYSAIARCGADAASSAYDLFGACAVTVRPA